MFDVGWSELVVIAVVAIIVVGPKDLPKMLRTAGQWARQARRLANEFKSSLDQVAREAELDEVKKSIHHITNFDPATRPEPYIKPAETPPPPLSEAKPDKKDDGATS